MYELLHEAETPENEIAEKYGIVTFDGYKADPSVTKNYTHLQRIAFTLVYAIHVGGDLPRYIVINRKMALNLLEELNKIPEEIEGVPLAFDEDNLFKITWLA